MLLTSEVGRQRRKEAEDQSRVRMRLAPGSAAWRQPYPVALTSRPMPVARQASHHAKDDSTAMQAKRGTAFNDSATAG